MSHFCKKISSNVGVGRRCVRYGSVSKSTGTINHSSSVCANHPIIISKNNNNYNKTATSFFSDYKKNEKEALLRALNNSDPTEQKMKGQGQEDDKINTKGRGGRSKKSTSRNGKSETTKKLTLDDFFSNLGKNKKSDSNDNTKIGKSAAAASTTTTKNQQNEKIASFFDDVDAIMAKKRNDEGKKGILDQINEPLSAKPKPSTSSTTSSSTTTTRTTTDMIRNNVESSAGQKSVFDMLPRKRITRSPNAFHEDTYDQYLEITEQALERMRKSKRTTISSSAQVDESIIEWLMADEPTVNYNLPLLEDAVVGGLSQEEGEDDSSSGEMLRRQCYDQKAKFLKHHNWDEEQHSMAFKLLVHVGRLSAKNATGIPLDVAWEKIKEMGAVPNADALSTYLYASSTFAVRPNTSTSSRGVSILDILSGTTGRKNDKEEENQGQNNINSAEETTFNTAEEVAIFNDILFGSTEQSASIRVRTLVGRGKTAEAELLLNSMPSEQRRLRTFAPIYQSYLDQADVTAAFKLYVRMKASENVQLLPENYIGLISCIAEKGLFRPGAEEIDGVKELGYKEASGPELFDSLASELADNTVEISSASAKRLYNAMLKGYEEDEQFIATNDTKDLKPLHMLESLKRCNDPAGRDELVISRVALDSTTGCCPRTGAQLRLISLDAEQKQKLQNGLLELSAESYDARQKGMGEVAQSHLSKFGKWLDERSGKPFTAIMDGPNVAFYMQNFVEGRFNFHQIEFVINTLEEMGENILVILPQKYTQNQFVAMTHAGKFQQRLTSKEKAIRDRLIQSGKCYIVPRHCHDDYYWMYASISSQINSTKGKEDDMYIPPDNADGRWPGIRPMLISNDKMRDHHLSLLEPRLFARWYSNFIVNFTFSAFVGEKRTSKDIGFETADFYSREIQCNPSFFDDVKNDDDDDDAGKATPVGLAWHFPVSDWDENESFCIRIPR